MSSYQVTDTCRRPILDWNYKWDLSAPSLCNSKKIHSNNLQLPATISSQEENFTFASELNSIKIEPPDDYPDYTVPYNFEHKSVNEKSTDFLSSNQIRLRDWSQHLENDYKFEEYASIQPSPKIEWPQILENNVLTDKCVDFFQTKQMDGEPSFSNNFVNDQYNDFTPLNPMKYIEWPLNPVNNFQSKNFQNNLNEFEVIEDFPNSTNLCSGNGSTIKQEYDDDIRLLELYTPNNGQYKMDFYQSGLAESYSGTQFLNDNMNDISNDSVQLLFERAGLEELMQNSPDQLIKELDDLVNDHVFPIDRKIKAEVPELETTPATFNRKHYKCSYCAFNTNGRARLTEHIERLHPEPYNSMRSTRHRKSRVRNSVDKENVDFLKENTTAKNRDKSYKCSECTYTTNHSERLKRHIENKHYIETYNRYNSFEKDPECLPHAFNQQNINQKTPKSDSKLHKCTQCDYKAHRYDRIKKHVAKIHSKNVCYKCNQCEYESSYNREYYKHMRTHYSGPPFKCDTCPYKSTLITAFIAHRVTHTGDRLFNCTLCKFSCKRKYHLKGHMISHSKVKNFTCEFCNKKYSYKCSLVRHINTSCKFKP